MKLKRLGILMLVLCVSISVLVLGASAADIVEQGTIGDNLTWTIDSDGTMTISGEGEMVSYDRAYYYPWSMLDCTKLVIEEGVTSIGDYAFVECGYSLESVDLSDSVKVIGKYAFENKSTLTTLKGLAAVETIGEYAFSGCTGLTTFTGATKLNKIDRNAFLNCTNLKTVELSTGLKSIEYGAFYNCVNLETIVIPDSVTDLGGAFTGCTGLKSVKLSSSLTEISSGLFSGCTSLSTITIPDNVTRVCWHAFSNCSNLKTVIFSKNVAVINNWVFEGCESLTDIRISSENPYLSAEGSIIYDANKETLIVCSPGKQGAVAIPDTVTTINEWAFSGCTEITSVEIPNGVTDIAYRAFIDCSSLASVTMPDNVQTIDAGAFSGCTDLSSINLPETVTRINRGAFEFCESLDTVTIPSKVESIEWWAFKDSGINTIYFTGNAPQFGVDVFMNVTATAYYPGNATWTSSVMQNYGGTISWKPLDKPLIVSQPKTAVASRDEVVKVSVKAVGTGLKYQWYIKNADATKYTKSSITSATYSCKMNDTTKDRYVYCVITDGNGESVKTDTVRLRMAVEIISQSKTTYTKQGATAKATVQAAGDGLTFQWYIKNAGATKYGKSSVTSATYSCKMTEASKDRLVYCVITDKYGNSVRTETVRLRMAATITKQPVQAGAPAGSVAKTTVTAVGDGLTYQWYIKNPGATKFSKSSVTSATYACKMSESNDGRQVYCVVTDKYGKTAKSDTVTINLGVQITKQPSTGYAKSGAYVKATVVADGDGLTYQWYFKDYGGSKYYKSSVTSATYSCKMTDASKNRNVYCVITDQYGNKVQTKTVRLRMAATITQQPVSVTVAEGSKATVTVSAVGDGLTYQWYFKDAGASSFKLTTTFTGSSYYIAMNEARDGRQVYCVVTDQYGKTVKSNVVTLSMK